MKKTDTITTKDGLVQALSMYKETVSPSKDMLINILNQIPEKEKLKVKNDGRAIRSPYIWLAVARVATVFLIVFAIYPTIEESYVYRNEPFYAVDKQIESFEAGINNEDYTNILVNYNNNL